MEDSGYEFYNDWGYRQDVLSILRDHGMNAVRLRVWVNPVDGYYSSLDDNCQSAVGQRREYGCDD